MLAIIVNPLAGGIKKMAKNIALVEARLNELNVEYKFYKTETPKHATLLTKQAISEGATTIVAMGGDGTLSETINGLDNFDKITFGLIPCGTGNDFATHLNLPLDPVKALDLILNTPATYIDFMQLQGVRGINIVGMGIDVEILKLYSKLKKKTKMGYYNCLLRTLCTYKCKKFDTIIEDERTSQTAFIACVANGSMFGGGIVMSPDAKSDDGKLDFVCVDEIKGLKIIPALLKLNGGKILKLKQSKFRHVERISVESDYPITVNVDGELYDDIPFVVQIVSNTLKMHR